MAAAALKRLVCPRAASAPAPAPAPAPAAARQLFSLLRRNLSQQSPPPEIPIQAVSYPTKPRDEEEEYSSYSRDEMRYMKDVIAPVSYPSRVAPLPDDHHPTIQEEQKGGGQGDRDRDRDRDRRRNTSNNNYEREGGLERERSKIEAYRRSRGVLSTGKMEEDDHSLPFPKIIKNKPAALPNNNNKKKKGHDLKEAIKLVKASAKNSFDETLEAHARFAKDLRDRTDLKLSSFVRLPHGFGKVYRVAVFAEGAAADEARDAGADIVGGPELVENIQTGHLKVDFDKCISTPSMMEHVKKLSKKLKKLMPDTKKGTLTNDISRTVKEAKQLSVLFKKDKGAIVHVGLGKLSFTDDALRENVGAFVNALLLAKPAGLSKSSKFAGYIDTIHICSTMGPSFSVSMHSMTIAAERYNRLHLK